VVVLASGLITSGFCCSQMVTLLPCQEPPVADPAADDPEEGAADPPLDPVVEPLAALELPDPPEPVAGVLVEFDDDGDEEHAPAASMPARATAVHITLRLESLVTTISPSHSEAGRVVPGREGLATTARAGVPRRPA
jgi:hypothetical protein